MFAYILRGTFFVVRINFNKIGYVQSLLNFKIQDTAQY